MVILNSKKCPLKTDGLKDIYRTIHTGAKLLLDMEE